MLLFTKQLFSSSWSDTLKVGFLSVLSSLLKHIPLLKYLPLCHGPHWRDTSLYFITSKFCILLPTKTHSLVFLNSDVYKWYISFSTVGLEAIYLILKLWFGQVKPLFKYWSFSILSSPFTWVIADRKVKIQSRILTLQIKRNNQCTVKSRTM